MLDVTGRLAQLCLLALGVVAVLWAGGFAPTFWKFALLEGLATQIVRTDRSSSALIEKALPTMAALERSEVCWPKAMHNAAIIRGRLVQVAIDNSDPDQFDKALVAANAAIRKSLSCAPTDAFLWFALFWVENLQFGYREESIRLLAESYKLGPYEGWIALRRNGYALLLYPYLPKDLQQSIVKEYAAVLNSGFVRESAATLRGNGWPVHDQLLAGLSGVNEKYKIQLATTLRRAGIEVNIPGITMPELRPWQVD